MVENIEEQKRRGHQHRDSTFIMIWLVLLVLSGVMITIGSLNLGQLSIWGTIIMTAMISTGVVVFFMQSQNEDRVFRIFLGLAMATLVIIMVLTFADVSYH